MKSTVFVILFVLSQLSSNSLLAETKADDTKSENCGTLLSSPSDANPKNNPALMARIRNWVDEKFPDSKNQVPPAETTIGNGYKAWSLMDQEFVANSAGIAPYLVNNTLEHWTIHVGQAEVAIYKQRLDNGVWRFSGNTFPFSPLNLDQKSSWLNAQVPKKGPVAMLDILEVDPRTNHLIMQPVFLVKEGESGLVFTFVPKRWMTDDVSPVFEENLLYSAEQIAAILSARRNSRLPAGKRLH